MEDRLDILLVNPDDRAPNNFPWGTLSVGSYLRRRGWKVRMIDASIEGEAAVLATIRESAGHTTLVGVSTMTRHTPFLKAVADAVKEANPSCKVIAGGPHIILSPEETAAYRNLDFIAYGEGEFTVDALLTELLNPDPDFFRVPGLLFKQDGDIRRTPPPPPAPFYDIDYDLLHPKVLATMGDYVQVLSGRGCSFKCTFCFNAVWEQKWRPRPVPELADELEALVRRFNPKVVYFRDENFFQNKKRAKDFVAEYKKRGFTFKWRATCRADYFNDGFINDAFLQELVDANLGCLKFGFESGSPAILEKLKKKIRIDQMERVARSMAKVDIEHYFSFIIGIPGETFEDYCKTMGFVGRLLTIDAKAGIIGPHYFRVYPGGELYNDILRDHPFQLPKSLEEWSEVYADPANDGGLDWGMEYPWVPPEGVWLAKNAYQLIWDFRTNFNPPGSDVFPAWALVPLRRMMLWRFRTGNYRFSFELRLLRWIRGRGPWFEGLLELGVTGIARRLCWKLSPLRLFGWAWAQAGRAVARRPKLHAALRKVRGRA